MSAKNALKGYCYQVNVLNAFVSKMDLKRKIKKIESEAEVEHNFDDIVITDENNNIFCFQVKNYENFDINKVTIENKIVKIVAGNTRSNSEFDSDFINGLVVKNEFECDSEILGFKSKLIDGIHIIPLTENNYDEQVGEYINISRKEHIQTQVINKISNAIFEFPIEELPKLSLFSNDLNHETVQINKLPEIIDKLSWHLGAPGTGKSHLVTEINEANENSIVYRFYADEHDQKRLNFDNFIEDFTKRIFQTPEKKTYAEIVNKVVEDDLLILVDGLDHVYNYQYSDLDKFLEFFKLLKDTKTLIFSRPFPEIMDNDNVFNIQIWDKESAFKYLEHYSFEDEVNEKIYELTSGYPIITYYLSEHYKKHGNLSNYSSKIDSINDYYKTILNDIKIKKPLNLFLFCNSYILESEIKELLYQNDSENLLEFIEMYPYLFTKELNRLHLFHDSFFTYLREKSEMDYEYPIEKVKESILSKNINFLSRFESFEFDDDFIKDVLRLYCSFDTFKELGKNFDFESVKIFYLNLRKILKDYPNVLDIYQYYSLILINLIVNRNDFYNEFGLFYQIFRYGDRKGYDENNIYSNRLMWNLYRFYKESNIKPFEKLLETEYYDSKRMVDELKRDWVIEHIFYSKNNVQLDENNIEEIIRHEYNYNLLEDYLAHIWINKHEDSKYFSLIDKYLSFDFHFEEEMEFRSHLKNLKLHLRPFRKILESSKRKLYQKGMFKDKNIYLQTPLKQYLKEHLKEKNTEIYYALLGYLRTYNNLNRDFEYSEIFKYFNMYSFRKDYSVLSIVQALLIFEKHELLTENESFELILNVMCKSEKGIDHLSLDYCAEKDPKTIKKLSDKIYGNFRSQINYLDSDTINKFPDEVISQNFLRFNQPPSVNFDRINNILKSKHAKTLCDDLKYLKFVVDNVPPKETEILENNDVHYEILEKKVKSDLFYTDKSFSERDYLKKEDYDEIISRDITHIELSQYQDGNHNCLAFPEFFKIYDKDKIKNDLLIIIHNAITQNLYFSDKYQTNTYLCLGNIPYLIDYYEYPIDWSKLFKIFKAFIEESSILYPLQIK